MIIKDQFRTFKRPLFPKLVTGQVLFLAVSYSKPAVRIYPLITSQANWFLLFHRFLNQMLLLERCCSTIGSKNGAIETISLQLISSLPLKSVQVFAHKCATKKLPKWFLQWWQLLKQDRTVDAFWCVFSTIIKRTRKIATQTVTTRFDSFRRVMMRFDGNWLFMLRWW